MTEQNSLGCWCWWGIWGKGVDDMGACVSTPQGCVGGRLSSSKKKTRKRRREGLRRRVTSRLCKESSEKVDVAGLPDCSFANPTFQGWCFIAPFHFIFLFGLLGCICCNIIFFGVEGWKWESWEIFCFVLNCNLLLGTWNTFNVFSFFSCYGEFANCFGAFGVVGDLWVLVVGRVDHLVCKGLVVHTLWKSEVTAKVKRINSLGGWIGY